MLLGGTREHENSNSVGFDPQCSLGCCRPPGNPHHKGFHLGGVKDPDIQKFASSEKITHVVSGQWLQTLWRRRIHTQNQRLAALAMTWVSPIPPTLQKSCQHPSHPSNATNTFPRFQTSEENVTDPPTNCFRQCLAVEERIQTPSPKFQQNHRFCGSAYEWQQHQFFKLVFQLFLVSELFPLQLTCLLAKAITRDDFEECEDAIFQGADVQADCGGGMKALRIKRNRKDLGEGIQCKGLQSCLYSWTCECIWHELGHFNSYVAYFHLAKQNDWLCTHIGKSAPLYVSKLRFEQDHLRLQTSCSLCRSSSQQTPAHPQKLRRLKHQNDKHGCQTLARLWTCTTTPRKPLQALGGWDVLSKGAVRVSHFVEPPVARFSPRTLLEALKQHWRTSSNNPSKKSRSVLSWVGPRLQGNGREGGGYTERSRHMAMVWTTGGGGGGPTIQECG